jgi:RimJ/RimL family protein N-acetyltransferase
MEGLRSDPPPVIRTERLLLRRWEPEDAALLDDAVSTSLDHLREWMPWAHAEPLSLAERSGLLRRFRESFVQGADFVYGVFAPDGARVLGGTGLHPRGDPGTLEIGYWIRADSLRLGLATETTAALALVALLLCGAVRVEVLVDPANAASLGVPRRLGFAEVGLRPGRLEPLIDGAHRDAVVFALDAGGLERSPVARARVACAEATGRPLPL